MNRSSTFPTSSNRYCQKCNYNLRGVTSERCPECGRRFDRGNRRTYRTHKRSWAGRFYSGTSLAPWPELDRLSTSEVKRAWNDRTLKRWHFYFFVTFIAMWFSNSLPFAAIVLLKSWLWTILALLFDFAMFGCYTLIHKRLRSMIRQRMIDIHLTPGQCFECKYDLAGVTDTQCPNCDAVLISSDDSTSA